ncbi:MAG TPA: acyl-CoA dehydrogenase family protein, partial [Polyangiaceae bacterium]|nr:acyl-CoA dehydrogenase family protein [Polyangiaceae bacterium]
MFDFVLNDAQRRIRDEARAFIKTIPRQLVLDMDQDKVDFPRDFLREAGRRNLLGCRYPSALGGRDLDWVA